MQNESTGEYYNGGGLIRTVPGKEGHLWVPLDQSQVWLAKGYSENGLAYTEDGGASWNRVSGVNTAIAVGIGKAKEGADYETIFIWGIAGGAENPLGIYRSTDKGKTWERINDDKHQFGGPGNGNFVQGDMNHFGVVYMSTVGRGLVVGAPKGTILPIPTKVNPKTLAASVELRARNLFVQAPAQSTLSLLGVNGKLCLQQPVSGNAQVSLSKIPAGKWIVKVVSENGKTLLTKTLVLR